jgi:hypothetical protein
VTTAGWRIEPQKTRGKNANRAARVSQRKFSANHAKSAYFQRKSRKVSVNNHLPYIMMPAHLWKTTVGGHSAFSDRLEPFADDLAGVNDGQKSLRILPAQEIPQQPCLRVGKLAVGGNFLRKLRLLSIAFSKILLIWQGVYNMECHVRIFFVHKYLRDILRFYTQRSDPCLIERITPIDIFRFAIKLDSRSRQRIRDAVALVRVRNCCNL